MLISQIYIYVNTVNYKQMPWDNRLLCGCNQPWHMVGLVAERHFNGVALPSGEITDRLWHWKTRSPNHSGQWIGDLAQWQSRRHMIGRSWVQFPESPSSFRVTPNPCAKKVIMYIHWNYSLFQEQGERILTNFLATKQSERWTEERQGADEQVDQQKQQEWFHQPAP